MNVKLNNLISTLDRSSKLDNISLFEHRFGQFSSTHRPTHAHKIIRCSLNFWPMPISMMKTAGKKTFSALYKIERRTEEKRQEVDVSRNRKRKEKRGRRKRNTKQTPQRKKKNEWIETERKRCSKREKKKVRCSKIDEMNVSDDLFFGIERVQTNKTQLTARRPLRIESKKNELNEAIKVILIMAIRQWL